MNTPIASPAENYSHIIIGNDVEQIEKLLLVCMGKLSLQHSSQYSTLVSQVRPDQREDRLCTGKKGDSNRFFFLHATGICWEPRGGSVEVWLRETNLRDSLNASRLGNRYLEVGSSTHLKGSQALFVHFIKLSLQCSRYLRLGCHFKGGRGRTHVVGVAATHVGQRTPPAPRTAHGP